MRDPVGRDPTTSAVRRHVCAEQARHAAAAAERERLVREELGATLDTAGARARAAAPAADALITASLDLVVRLVAARGNSFCVAFGPNAGYIVLVIGLVLLSGTMSGLTLGLLSLDMVDMEVLLRSGSVQEKKYAASIVPLISNQHQLLVTLLLCNAAAMETLPIFLDKLTNPIVAIVVSVTAVLLFGEIIPQALCARHGLAIGANLFYLVRFLMLLTFPISWPMSKLLDFVLGAEQLTLFRRKQLKALVDIHGDVGMGGNLTVHEVRILGGSESSTHARSDGLPGGSFERAGQVRPET
ncbi:MAG: hypothetical protein WDW36_009487 [Sanguina aurantia]